MEDLIKQAFAHVENLNHQVQAGHYDLIGPDGEIILPMVWDKTIQPGWQISMRMWPPEKHPLPGPHGPMSPQQRMHFEAVQRMHAAARAGHGGRPHHGGGGLAQPMRPPGYTGGVPAGGMPPPPPGRGPFPPPGGMGMGRPPPGVDIVEGGRPSKKDKGKKSKGALGFFAGTKPKKREKKYLYTEPSWVFYN